MAHHLITSNPSVKVFPGNVVTPTVRAYCASIPSGIGFVYEVPQDAFNAGAAGSDLLDVIGTGIESCVTGHHVIGGVSAQDFDKNGLLQDYADLTVAYQPAGSILPPATAIAHIPIDSFFTESFGGSGVIVPGGGPSPQEICDETYNQLVALAGG